MKLRASHIGIILLATPLSSQVQADEACRTLTATGGPSYAPANWIWQEQLTGYMPALLRAIGDQLNITTSAQPSGSWKRALANVENGRFDIILGLSKNAERLEKFDYTVPVAYDPVTIAVVAGSNLPYNGTWQSLVGYQGGVRLGVRFAPALDIRLEQELTVRRVPDYDSAFKQLQRGRLDYVMESQFVLQVHAAELAVLQTIEILTPPLVKDDVYMAFSKRSACKHLIDDFSHQISNMKAAGEVDRLVQQYQELKLQQLK